MVVFVKTCQESVQEEASYLLVKKYQQRACIKLMVRLLICRLIHSHMLCFQKTRPSDLLCLLATALFCCCSSLLWPPRYSSCCCLPFQSFRRWLQGHIGGYTGDCPRRPATIRAAWLSAICRVAIPSATAL